MALTARLSGILSWSAWGDFRMINGYTRMVRDRMHYDRSSTNEHIGANRDITQNGDTGSNQHLITYLG